MEARIVDALLKYRYLLSLLCLLAGIALTLGGKNLYFDSDYKSFFNKDDPQLLAFESQQQAYTKSDSLIFLLKPATGDIFTAENLQLIKEVTEQSWQAPYSIRVDSLSNFQYSWSEDDALTVEDLIGDVSALSAQDIQRIKTIALSEKELVNRLISKDGTTTMINVSVELPEIDPTAPAQQQVMQRQAKEASFAEVAAFGNRIKSQLLAEHPGLTVHLMGVPILNHTFNQSAASDSESLIPLMYGVILLALAVFFRSAGSVIACMVVIGLGTLGGMGLAGWVGYTLNSVTVIAPVIILTIAVCDSVHLIAMYQRHLAMGETPLQALRESLIVNLQPIILTSVTTAVGFLTLNFSDSPFFRALGNISAFGVMFAMVISLTLMPMLVALLVRKGRPVSQREKAVSKVADFVIARKKPVFWSALAVALCMVALLPLNHIDNDPINYFKHSVPYRQAASFSQTHLPGIKDMYFSIDCGEPDCIHEPDFLTTLEAFGDWMVSQPEVEFVSSYADVVKRLNRNMHGDDPAWYKVPESRELAAQYQLLYEMSLPYGLDLNNQINFDKNSIRVGTWSHQTTTGRFVDLERRALGWFEEHAPALKTRGASVDMMFAAQAERNIRSMILGAVFALIGITITILLSMRSIKYGVLSMVPNAFPAAMGMGLWGVMVGEINSGVTIVFSITLGLVVDNTVHFISKYRRARLKGNDAEQAIRYAFSTVGSALLISTAVLTIGFGLLTLSDFNLNAYMGALTAMTIVIALIFDFLMLPALLLLMDGKPAAVTAAAPAVPTGSPT